MIIRRDPAFIVDGPPIEQYEGYGPQLFTLLSSLKDALPQNGGGREQLMKSFRQAQDFILTNSDSARDDLPRVVKLLLDISYNQPFLRKMAAETITALYNKAEETTPAFDKAVEYAFTGLIKSTDADVRRAVVLTAGKLGLAAVTRDGDKTSFAGFLSRAFNAERDPFVKDSLRTAWAGMASAEAEMIAQKAQQLVKPPPAMEDSSGEKTWTRPAGKGRGPAVSVPVTGRPFALG